MDFSTKIKEDTVQGLSDLFKVDEDISNKFSEVVRDDIYMQKFNQAIESVYQNLISGRKIYIYGCGATGRLAKQIESEMWKPFWNRLRTSFPEQYIKILDKYPDVDFENSVIGELTGGDRALVSSLEGFEDLQLIGHLQYQDNGIKKGDVVFAVTEGGETSSVIGTILYAAQQYGENPLQEEIKEAQKHLYYIYNNTQEVLEPFDRCRAVFENELITKISLFTGNQAISGSTRMQASTTDQFFVSMILENAVNKIMNEILTEHDLLTTGFPTQIISIQDQLEGFRRVQDQIMNSIKDIAKFTDTETSVYKNQKRTFYFAQYAIVTIFTDMTERSPTFSLLPIDTVNAPVAKSWAQMFTNAETSEIAWRKLLGRSYIGLRTEIYQEPFEKLQILRQKALDSLKQAGPDQEFLFDFSFSKENQQRSVPKEGDLGVLVLFTHELQDLQNESSMACQFLKLLKEQKAQIQIIIVKDIQRMQSLDVNEILASLQVEAQILEVNLDLEYDPMTIRHSIALKMIMNAHSTAVMAKMGKVVGNTMTNVRAGNLKLIGRATYLIQSHVNLTLQRIIEPASRSKYQEISYNEANTVLFSIMNGLNCKTENVSDSPVPIAIIQILESIKKDERISFEQALQIQQEIGLEKYLATF
eukprot:403366111